MGKNSVRPRGVNRDLNDVVARSEDDIKFWKEELVKQMLPQHLTYFDLIKDCKLSVFSDKETVYYKNTRIITFYNQEVVFKNTETTFKIKYEIHNILNMNIGHKAEYFIPYSES